MQVESEESKRLYEEALYWHLLHRGKKVSRGHAKLMFKRQSQQT